MDCVGAIEHVERALLLLEALEECKDFDLHNSYYYYNIIVIDGLCKAKKLDTALPILSDISSIGLEPNVITYNMIITGSCQEQLLEEGKKILLEIDGRKMDLITYNVIVQGLLVKGEFDEGAKFHEGKDERGFLPDSSTFALNSPFCEEILSKSLGNFYIPDLPKYDGSTDPKQHVVAYENLMTMHNLSDALNSQIFVTSLTGRAQEWFTNLPTGCIVNYLQFIHKFDYHFSSKRKYAKSEVHLFSIKQKEDENLQIFVDHFNDEVVDVQGLTNEIKINLMINALKMGPFADALIRDRLSDMEELMMIAQKYIYAEEMNEIKREERRVQK
ncbi:hypothetical protein BUALT_Bualt06G0040800 [Buddleja alternifolia]|uniref:Retrotransposon gag domain-containing protein n=1 Tax=Buddleja alternifolia TaxID=168488 RepID=A0AAV6XNI3_9LAMI|nr:hypothetical protein BUALT_Bualt06G0040800 [Buddleja alternifolia]